MAKIHAANAPVVIMACVSGGGERANPTAHWAS